ncbi:MAG: hypothetical protein PHR47_02590 [Candidatus Pacebacteria bacterium]|nr:hypothetical protein [Candidatus Paceibacterota bacterium]
MTQSEINKLHKSIATDFKIATRRTELWNLSRCYNVLHDIKKLMMFNYLENISLIMTDVNNLPIKVKKYLMASAGQNENNDRPGSIDWEDGEGHDLCAIVSYNQNYLSLSVDEINNFRISNLKETWHPSYMDTGFPHLRGVPSKNYAHENSKINRIDFD